MNLLLKLCNQLRFQKTVEKILLANHSLIAFFGLSFKKNSDDLRDSPFVELAEILTGKGIKLKIYDPDVQICRVVGKNLEILNYRTAHLSAYLQNDMATTLEGCDGIIICKNFINSELHTFIQNHTVPVYDLGCFMIQKKEHPCVV